MIRPRIQWLPRARAPGASPPPSSSLSSSLSSSIPSSFHPSFHPSFRLARHAHTDADNLTFKVPELGFPDSHVPNLLTKEGFKVAWTDYHTLLCRRLSDMVAGTPMEGDDAKTILIKTAREPSQAHIFNHASMMHNNHFFFSGLSWRTDQPQPAVNTAFLREIEYSFGSIDGLRREMLVMGLTMFGPGFVWLVRVIDRRLMDSSSQAEIRMHLRLVPTYLAGSPYAEAHWRRQAVDMNTSDDSAWRRGPMDGTPMGGYQRPYGSVTGAEDIAARRNGGDADAELIAPGGAKVVPLLCLNTWEHVWLTDYGIGTGPVGGKKEYVQRWWRAINWDKVRDLALRRQ